MLPVQVAIEVKNMSFNEGVISTFDERRTTTDVDHTCAFNPRFVGEPSGIHPVCCPKAFRWHSDVGRREANRAAAVISVLDYPLNGEIPTEKCSNEIHLTVSNRGTDPGGRHDAP